jgi:hypothetical protein
MDSDQAPDPPAAEAFLAGQPLGLAALAWVRDRLAGTYTCTERVGRSQVAFRRRRGFAYLWLPGQYLARPTADVVLSLALDHELPSARWKEVVEPTPGRWMHHLELQAESDLDAEVAGWLLEAAAGAG